MKNLWSVENTGLQEISYYHKMVVVAAIGIFYTNVPPYIYALIGPPLEAKHWMMAFWLSSLPILFLYTVVWNAFKSPVMLWCFGYAVLTLLWFAVSSQSDHPWQEVRNRFLAIIEILTVLMIFWSPEATQLARKMLIPAVLLGVAINIYELFVPMSFSMVLGRSAGLYINPIMAGEALVLGMILSVTILKPRYRGPFMLLTGIGVLTTFSRAPILGWVIAVTGLMFMREVSLKDFVPSVFLGLALVVLVLLPQWDHLLTTWERNGMLNSNVEERLAWFTDPSGVSDYSSWERKYLAKRAWDQISERPIIGSGTGSSYEAYIAPHNQFLAFMLDHGLIGATILPMLMLAMMWRAQGELRRVAIVFGLTTMELSLFTHTILNTAYSLLLFSLMGAMASMNGYRETTTTRAREIEVGREQEAFVRA